MYYILDSTVFVCGTPGVTLYGTEVTFTNPLGHLVPWLLGRLAGPVTWIHQTVGAHGLVHCMAGRYVRLSLCTYYRYVLCTICTVGSLLLSPAFFPCPSPIKHAGQYPIE